MQSEYKRVKSTLEERQVWRRKHGDVHQPPYRVVCECGKRFWLSGLAVGSHRRACPGAPK